MATMIYEELDIHPIIGANPFLIEEGARVIRGEKYLDNTTLKHIDLHMVDKNNIPLYVEVKWSSFDPSQMKTYYELLKKEYNDKPFRLMWFVPDDMSVSVPSYVELRKFSKDKYIQFVELRKKAKAILEYINKELLSPVTLPRSLMYREEVTFPNIISACYFEGKVITERGTKKVGLRKSTVGRYLDLIRCISQSGFRDSLPELTLLFIRELLIAPYFYLRRSREGVVDSKGFYNHIFESRRSGYYKPISNKLIPTAEKINTFANEEASNIKKLYENDPAKYDLLYRVLMETPPKVYDMNLLIVKRHIEYLIDVFSLKPQQSVEQVRHNLTNQWVKNSVKTDGFENDLAKRIIEIAVLRRILIPVSGIPVMWVLTANVRDEKMIYSRTQAQNFQLNKEYKFVRPIDQYKKEVESNA